MSKPILHVYGTHADCRLGMDEFVRDNPKTTIFHVQSKVLTETEEHYFRVAGDPAELKGIEWHRVFVEIPVSKVPDWLFDFAKQYPRIP